MQVCDNLDRGYSGLKEEERPQLRRSIKRLLLQWAKSEAEYKRWRNTEGRRPTLAPSRSFLVCSAAVLLAGSTHAGRHTLDAMT